MRLQLVHDVLYFMVECINVIVYLNHWLIQTFELMTVVGYGRSVVNDNLEIWMHRNKGPSSEVSPLLLVTMWLSLLLRTLFRHSAEQDFNRQVIICQEACTSLVVILLPAESNWNLTSASIWASWTLNSPYLLKMSWPWTLVILPRLESRALQDSLFRKFKNPFDKPL